jgi:hypothetical protein
MDEERPEPCLQREVIEAFAHDQLDGAQRREAERVLEQSEPCRQLFRQLTAGRYPRLPNYTIIGQIGKGGFGVVYKAIHHAKERTEALKVLFSKTPLLTSYFENEVHLIARLRHPNIATLYDAQLSTPPLYYTMEFVEGERLNDYLKKREASLAARIEIIKTVARAVGYAHAQSVVHRDLKPQNVLLDRDGQPHIVDFGIAKKLALVEAPPQEAEDASDKKHEGPVGTLGYIAPEQEKGGPVDARADIYALGALLFHCVTGEPARLASVADQRIRILRERQVAQPEDLAAIVGRCVEGSPDDRYATCADLVADLDNYLTGRPIDAREDRTWAGQVFRIAALVMRESPVTVRTAVLILVAAFLTWYFWAVESWAVGGGSLGDRTVMIGFTDETLEAIKEKRIGADLPGLSPYDFRSWRMLYGRVMERLAEASPLMVVWDGWLDECSEFDEDLVRGMRALRATGVPVVIGALRFDINGEPEMCPEIRPEIDGYGTVFGIDTRKQADAYEVAYCVQRGYESPIPGLALAALAAYRFPDCDRRLRLDADAEVPRVYIQYRRRNPQPGKSPWEEDPTGFKLHDVRTVKSGDEGFDDFLDRQYVEEGDKVAHAEFYARPNAFWASEGRTISVEQVLASDAEQLKAWFDDRAIVIGHMRRGIDDHTRKDGEQVFGCQLHAEAIDQLLANIQHSRFYRRDLAMRNVFWCGVAVLVVSAQGRRKWRSLRWVMLICSLLFVGGVVLGGEAGIHIRQRWLLELLIATSGLLTAGSLTFWTKAVRDRQLVLAPSAITLATEGPTLASTVLAETR